MIDPFYHNTIRKIVVSFGSLFNELQIDREDSNGVYNTIPVPLSYSTKEKFVWRINDLQQPGDDTITIEETLPKMSYELTGLMYDAERKESTIQKMRSNADDNIYMFQRVPYNLEFSLYIATRKIDDSLRIIEQILPYFTPELTMRIIDVDALQVNTNIPITLNSPDFEIDSQGAFSERRTVFWTLNFTAQCYLYANYRNDTVIKKATIDIKDLETGNFYERFITEVDPIGSNSFDDYNIVDTVTNDESVTTGI